MKVAYLAMSRTDRFSVNAPKLLDSTTFFRPAISAGIPRF